MIDAKRAAALAALAYVDPDEILGVGSGRTVDEFITLLGDSNRRPKTAVAASLPSARALSDIGIHVVPLESAGRLPIYIDGADEIDPVGRMLKGAGGAHASEKRIASASDCFVCILDESKPVELLGLHRPVVLEVIPDELASVTDHLVGLGAEASLRSVRSEADNHLVDVYGLDLSDPEHAERKLDALPGVVACSLFANQRACVALIGNSDGTVRTLKFRPNVPYSRVGAIDAW